jgi:hypothetical protein
MQNSLNERENPIRLASIFDGYTPDRAKWRNIVMELFNLDFLKDSLIGQYVAHI